MSKFKNRVGGKKIIEKYFSNPDKTLRLAPGDVLLDQFAPNDKLFLVVSGKICGYLPDQNLHEPVFEARANSFCGVYSYFSDDSKSYSRLVAAEPSVVSYYNDNPLDLSTEERLEFMTYLFEVVVDELRHRQMYAGKMAHERQETLQKLIHSEKMVTLGQMAAGIAHELNNAIGSMSSNMGQFQENISTYLRENEANDVMNFYRKGLEEGQTLSSSEARKARTDLESLKFLDKGTIKTLSRAGVKGKELVAAFGKTEKLAHKAAFFWELGYLLHDMQIAAAQSSHVIQSVKSAAVTSQKWTKNANINQTIHEALAILRTITKEIEIVMDLDKALPVTEVCTGEIMQIWINLIKNAAESLLNSDTKNPKVTVMTRSKGKYIVVSIIDNGPGIPRDLLESVFQPNFTTKIGGLSFGLGLGLTIVQRIIDEHNGRIELSSQPGATRFDVFLPIVNDK